MDGVKPEYLHCNKCDARKLGAFSVLNCAELDRLQGVKESQKFSKRHLLFQEGQEATAAFCLRKGVVKLHGSVVEGRKQILTLAKPGQIMGLNSILTGQPYAFSATAVSDCQVCVIDSKCFLNILDQSPQIVRFFLENTCSELDHLALTVCNLSQKGVRERIAQTLLFLKEHYGVTEGGDTKLKISLTRQEIADLTGTVLETAVRFLSEFNQDGFIELKGREITIKNLEALERLALLKS